MSDPAPLNSADLVAIARLSASLELPSFDGGWVWLAGAGPGDAGLITLLGLHAIANADVILFDALVNESLLKFASPSTDVIYAGKRRGQACMKQNEISRQLVAFARKGKRVLRLKGGDPFVFGRGGEEASALVRGNVPFRIVPGVTAGIGGLAYAGIPVTHRDTNHAVTFVTGHGVDGNIPMLDWAAVAKSPTIVLYMGLAHADEIAAKLIAAGRASSTPAAIISHAATEKQTVLVATLGELGQRAKEAQAPAMLVIGENVRLREGLDWIGAMGGKRLDPDPLKRDGLSDAI